MRLFASAPLACKRRIPPLLLFFFFATVCKWKKKRVLSVESSNGCLAAADPLFFVLQWVSVWRFEEAKLGKKMNRSLYPSHSSLIIIIIIITIIRSYLPLCFSLWSLPFYWTCGVTLRIRLPPLTSLICFHHIYIYVCVCIFVFTIRCLYADHNFSQHLSFFSSFFLLTKWLHSLLFWELHPSPSSVSFIVEIVPFTNEHHYVRTSCKPPSRVHANFTCATEHPPQRDTHPHTKKEICHTFSGQ